jgi:hypothetical protein
MGHVAQCIQDGSNETEKLAASAARLAQVFHFDNFAQVVLDLAVRKIVAPGTLNRSRQRSIRLLSCDRRVKGLNGSLLAYYFHVIVRFSK